MTDHATDSAKTDLTPNEKQRELIEGTEGVYLVDAGAGTGKTFAITRRYANIVADEAVDPDDILLVTFTRSGATEMKERIVEYCEYEMRELADAPIQTFHAHCNDLLSKHGHDVPSHLGIEERLSDQTRIIEDDLVEAELFREFLGQFRDDHPEHTDIFRAISDPGELRSLLSQLAAKGVVPTTEGWYRDGESHLDGDFESFESLFAQTNRPRNDGSVQSELRAALGRYDRNSTYRPDAPTKSTLRGGRGTKQLDPEIAATVFHENRKALKSFVHDLYVGYLSFALSRNYLTFGFLQVFAYVLLCEDPAVRDRAGFEYVMVDEFQDTSELQFKLTLLLCDTDNLCVVGDWRQSIYSFQYADVCNITEFESRLETFSTTLNADEHRVSVADAPVQEITFVENYRSTRSVLDLSRDALVTPATGSDTVDGLPVGDDAGLDPTDVDSLSPNAAFDNTNIRAISTGSADGDDAEAEAVLSLVADIVGNDEYAVEGEDGNPRPPDYGDIAIFTRTRSYGRDLVATAEEYGVAMAYDGGVELFRTDPSKLLLAWLRILDSGAERGWAVVLERAGYSLDEVDHLLESEAYPAPMEAFAADLRAMGTVASTARRVFDRYGLTGAEADALVDTLRSVQESTTLTRGEIIQFVERGIENGTVQDIRRGAGADSVTVQTIHGAKGLEYPIVILANMNEHAFPPSGGGSSDIEYTDPVGLRQRTVYSDDGRYPHVYDNWRSEVLRQALPRSYDEERRLLYVAITRAQQHVCFASGENPNTFLQELPVDIEQVDPSLDPFERQDLVQTGLPFAITTPSGPIGHTPHTLMDQDVFDTAGETGNSQSGGSKRKDDGRETESAFARGREYGTRVHEFAEDYANGEAVSPVTEDEHNVVAFLDGLDGELHTERQVTLPLEVDGQRVTITGVVDLVQETPRTVHVVDYKTDTTRRATAEYRLQASIYYHVLADWFDEKDVRVSLYYTADAETVEQDPYSVPELRQIIRERADSLG